jgi:hypothetical protein
MGVAECTTLVIEEECDDLVDAISGGEGFKCDGGYIVLAS